MRHDYPDPMEEIRVANLAGSAYTITYNGTTTEPIQWNDDSWGGSSSAERALQGANDALKKLEALTEQLRECVICGEQAPGLIFCDACGEVVREVRRAYFRRLFEEFMAE